MVLSENSCTGKPEVDCPTVGAVDGLGTCKQNGNAISYRNTKGAGKKPALKVHDLYRNPKRERNRVFRTDLAKMKKALSARHTYSITELSEIFSLRKM